MQTDAARLLGSARPKVADARKRVVMAVNCMVVGNWCRFVGKLGCKVVDDEDLAPNNTG